MADDTLAACLVEIKANPGKFYVYVLSRPCGTPFYVGCGKVRSRGCQRIVFHESEAKTAVASHKCNVIRAVWRAAKSVHYAIDSWHESEPAMFRREVELISHIGRADRGAGPLTNWSDGGDGLVNRADEVRAKAAQSMMALVDDEWRAASSVRTKRDWDSPEGRAKRMLVNASPETKKRQREASIRAAATPSIQLAKREAMLRRWHSDPEYREKQRAAHSAAASSSAVREKIAQTTKERWADPAYRERLREAHRKRHAQRREERK